MDWSALCSAREERMYLIDSHKWLTTHKFYHSSQKIFRYYEFVQKQSNYKNYKKFIGLKIHGVSRVNDLNQQKNNVNIH